VAPAPWVLGALPEQRAPRDRRGLRRARSPTELPVEDLGEPGGIPIVDRAIPADHITDLGGELAREGGTELGARSRRRPFGLARQRRITQSAAADCRRRPASLGRAARREHDERRLRLAQRVDEVARAGGFGAAFGGLEQQHRAPARDDVAVAGEMHRLEWPLLRGEPSRQEAEIAGLFHHHVHALLAPCRLEDRRFLGLVVEVDLALGRGRHEHQLHVPTERLPRRRRRADPAGDGEELQGIDRQRPAAACQQLPRCVHQSELAGIIPPAQPDLQGAVPGHFHPCSRPAGLVEPSEHLAPDRAQLVFAIPRGGGVVACGPRLEALCRIVEAETGLRPVALDGAEDILADQFDPGRRHELPQVRALQTMSIAAM
jgi:hypothetical protein